MSTISVCTNNTKKSGPHTGLSSQTVTSLQYKKNTTEIESKYLETFKTTWQNHFMSVEFKSKKLKYF